MEKTVLITGASSGFGLMLANNLHQQGFNVIGTSRAPEKYAGKVPFKLLRLNTDARCSGLLQIPAIRAASIQYQGQHG